MDVIPKLSNEEVRKRVDKCFFQFNLLCNTISEFARDAAARFYPSAEITYSSNPERKDERSWVVFSVGGTVKCKPGKSEHVNRRAILFDLNVYANRRRRYMSFDYFSYETKTCICFTWRPGRNFGLLTKRLMKDIEKTMKSGSRNKWEDK